MSAPVDLRNVVLEVTRDCNNACAHCYNYWRNGAERLVSRRPLSRTALVDLVRKVARDAPLEQVALSGGEPLVRPDAPEIVQDLVGMGIGVVVITNGSLLDEARLVRFPAGCTFEVTLFSADGALHDRIAGRRVFDRLLENLARLEPYGHGLVVACVVTRLNAHDVTRTVQLAVALGAQAILLNRVNLARWAFLGGTDLVPTAAQLQDGLRAADHASKAYGIPVLVSVPIPPCIADPADYPNLHFGWCPRGGKGAYYTIGCNGELRPCNHSSVVLGDLRTRSFAEIVGSPQARAFWASDASECRDCIHPLRERCLGGCPAAADECYGTPGRRDPFVDVVLAPASCGPGEPALAH